MGPASNQLTWLLTRIQERRLHWVTSERSSWPDSTASPCRILTVTSFITFQHCSHPVSDFFQHSAGHGREGSNDRSAIEQKFSQYFTGLALALCCTKCLPSEYYSHFTPVFTWLRHSVDQVDRLLFVLWWTVRMIWFLVPSGIKTTVTLTALCVLLQINQSSCTTE